jgi:ferrochelatase
MKKKLAVVLFNLGGPNATEDIQPFLKNLFSDKAIIDLPLLFRMPLAYLISTTRAPKAKPLYDLMGGFSPLLKNTTAQADALLKSLVGKLENYEIKTIIAMRYWNPLSKEAAQQLVDFNPDEVVLLPLYPHYSRTTTGSSVKEFQKYYKGKARLVRDYPVLDGYIKANVKSILSEYEKLGKPEKVRVLFSAHGLPQKVVDSGDVYEIQIKQSAAAIAKELPENFESVVCFQSKVGPLKWLEPSTPNEVKRAGKDNIAIIICPIAFVSDHIETLVELDVEYKELAHEEKVPQFGRAAVVGCDDDFINGLSDLVIEHLEKTS